MAYERWVPNYGNPSEVNPCEPMICVPITSFIPQVQIWPMEDIELIINKRPHKVIIIDP